MSKWITLLLALPLLAACSPEATSRLQQQASAAIGSTARLAGSSEPLAEIQRQGRAAASAAAGVAGQYQEQASAALGVAARIGNAAGALDPELGQQIDAVKQAADALQGK